MADGTLNRARVLALSGHWSGVAIAALVLVVVLAVLLAVTALRLRRRSREAALLQQVLDNSGEALVGLDAQARFSTWNRAATRLLGYAREEVLGRPVTTLVPDDRREEMLEHLDRIWRGEAVRGWETARRRPDGTRVDVEINVDPTRDSEGRVTGTVARLRDIRERRVAEERFRTLLQAAPDAIVIVDESGHITLANDQAEAVFGYTAAELVGRPVECLVPERLVDAHAYHRERYRRDPRRRPMSDALSLTARHKDGREVPVEVSLSPLQTDAGLRVIAAVRDVTERRRAAQALTESEELFRRAFEDSGVGMAIVRPEEESGYVLEMNHALGSLIGYSLEEFRALGALSIVHPEDLPELVGDIREINAGRVGVIRTDVRLIDAQGRVVWTAVTGSLVRDSAGDPLHVLMQVQDVSERKRFEGQLQYLADHDTLTGLFNRRRFDEELEREVVTARRYGHSSAVLVLDLDHFKVVNDSRGHAAGDELITIIGDLLRRRLRTSDIVGRMGGDEFAIILPRADEAEARRMGESLLREVRADVRATKVNGDQRVTASVGVALFGHRTTAVSSEELLAEADIAMYDAKEAGRDRLAVYDAQASRHTRIQTSLAWVQQIESALASDRFVLHAQPILPIGGDGGERRYELLLRMVGEDGELIPPATFLDAAERHGLAVSIDRWVIAHAGELLAEQHRRGNHVVFEVNLSAVSVTNPRMLEFIGETVSRWGIGPRRLVVEVTETAAIVNVAQAKAFVHGLREIGCEFAIDDFGAGFASFYYLKHLSFDFLKIDGEFIRELADSHTNQLVVRSVADIARGLGKRTIAEFVDSASTLELLREYGVDYAQGFYTGRPRSVQEIDFAADPVEAHERERATADARPGSDGQS